MVHGLAMATKSILAAVVVLLVLFQSAPAGAHGEMVGSSPAKGETVGGDFDRIDVVFAEPISQASVQVEGPAGLVDGEMVQSEGLVIAFGLNQKLADGQHTVTVTFDSLDQDLTTVDFQFTYLEGAPEPFAVVASTQGTGSSLAGRIAIVVLIACSVGLAGLLAWRYKRLSTAQT